MSTWKGEQQRRFHWAEFTSHAPGTFSWVELATSDPKAGVAFYRALFGWDAVEHHAGPNGIYTMFTMRGLDVAAGAGQHPEERQMGIPPHWNLYVTVSDGMPDHVPSFWMPYFQVADLDASSEKAKSLDGSVMVGPNSIPDEARFAIMQDPQKAVFALYQPAR